MTTNGITFHDAGVGYGTRVVLTGVQGRMNPGEALALVGPNGSGKTTLLKALARSVPILEGHIDGIPDTIGYVPQSADLDLTFPITVEQVVMMGLYKQIGLARFPRKAHREKVVSTLTNVGLLSRAKDRFGELSGGQRQRVLVARALIAHPKLILLDEPFNGLDQPNRDALLGIIRRAKNDGTSVVVSTHDLSLAYDVCDQAILVAGRQIAFGPVREVLTPKLLKQAYGSESLETEACELATCYDSRKQRGEVA